MNVTQIMFAKRKLLASLVLVGVTTLSQAARADTGPYYVSYPGFCNVKTVYITLTNDVYGSEIGCSATYGQPVMGFISPAGNVYISRYSGTSACMETYWANGDLTGACSDGTSVSYSPNSFYSVRAAMSSGAAPATRPANFSVSTEKPDLQATKNLPARP